MQCFTPKVSDVKPLCQPITSNVTPEVLLQILDIQSDIMLNFQVHLNVCFIPADFLVDQGCVSPLCDLVNGQEYPCNV